MKKKKQGKRKRCSVTGTGGKKKKQRNEDVTNEDEDVTSTWLKAISPVRFRFGKFDPLNPVGHVVETDDGFYVIIKRRKRFALRKLTQKTNESSPCTTMPLGWWYTVLPESFLAYMEKKEREEKVDLTSACRYPKPLSTYIRYKEVNAVPYYTLEWKLRFLGRSRLLFTGFMQSEEELKLAYQNFMSRERSYAFD